MRRKQFFIILLAAVLFAMNLPASRGPAEALPVPDEMLLHEPIVSSDSTLSTGQVTEWSCITFGSYPQAEIVPAPSSAVDAYAADEGSFVVDPVLYGQLEQASWIDNETEMNGVRYLRLNRSGAVSSAANRKGQYRWEDGYEWHYFRFDPIRWRVIALEGENALLMADRLLDCQPFHTDPGPVGWADSTVRSWLNGLSGEENTAGIDYGGKGFVDMAFSATERKALVLSHVVTRANARYGTDCGSDTDDYVFLLSNDEVFGTDEAARHGFYPFNGKDDPAKRFRSTMYAKCRGSWWSSVNGYMGNSFWFMRTNGYNRASVSYICDFGYIYQRGTVASCGDSGILPALRIRLDMADYETAGTVSSRDIQEYAAAVPTETRNSKAMILNPSVVPDDTQPDGKTVTYSLVRFGTYPQSEVIPAPSAISGSSIADADLYADLEQADWENDRCELDGTAYVRILPSGAGAEEHARYFACEPLLWRVLEVRDGIALLLSHAAIECKAFQQDLTEVSWENCTLRSWLNGYGKSENASGIDYSGSGCNFLDMAFSEKEQEAILSYPVRNECNYYFGTDSGGETADKVSLPAESELFAHDSSKIHGFSPRDDIPDRAKQFTPTDYAVLQGAWHASGDSTYGNVFWITRTTGYTHANVVYVDESGYMYNRGILVTCDDAAIIPALVLDLDTSVYEYAGAYTVGEQ